MSFTNIESGESFNIGLTTTIARLSSFPCTEATLINRTGQAIYIYDKLGIYADNRRLSLPNDQQITLKGLTNTDSLSASTASASGTLYVRAHSLRRS